MNTDQTNNENNVDNVALTIQNDTNTNTNSQDKRKKLGIKIDNIQPNSHPYDKIYNYKDNISDVDSILIRMRKNCVFLSMYHNRRYHFYKNLLFCCFRIPLIVFSGLNSFFAVGLQNYLDQKTISLLNAMVSLFCGILTSVELLWQLKDRLENELVSHKNFYRLSTDIFQFLQLDNENRAKLEKDFLSETYDLYQKYIEMGNAINVYRRGFLDELEYINNTDKEQLTIFLQTKMESDLKTYYFSKCCL